MLHESPWFHPLEHPAPGCGEPTLHPPTSDELVAGIMLDKNGTAYIPVKTLATDLIHRSLKAAVAPLPP